MFQMFGPKASRAEEKDKEGNKIYKSDVNDFVRWGAVGFVAMGLYQLGLKMNKRNISKSAELKVRTEAMDCDPIILEALINIQHYKDLAPWFFEPAVTNIDRLLFLENAMLKKDIIPMSKDKSIAFIYFKVGLNRLNEFQYIVKEEMGNDHGATVNIYVKKIYEQIQKHFINCLHMCGNFKPENFIKRAEEEVQKVLADAKSGKKPKKK